MVGPNGPWVGGRRSVEGMVSASPAVVIVGALLGLSTAAACASSAPCPCSVKSAPQPAASSPQPTSKPTTPTPAEHPATGAQLNPVPSAPVAPSPPPASEKIAGWFLAGSAGDRYRIVRDREIKQSGQASARLESVNAPADKFGTLMQTSDAMAFRGKRLRFSAALRAKDVSGRVGLWMRIDRERDLRGPFDNMDERPISGSSDWRRDVVVLDVPRDAERINYGLILQGTGMSWIDDAQLEVVDRTTPLTGGVPGQPRNLDFEAASDSPLGWFVWSMRREPGSAHTPAPSTGRSASSSSTLRRNEKHRHRARYTCERYSLARRRPARSRG